MANRYSQDDENSQKEVIATESDGSNSLRPLNGMVVDGHESGELAVQSAHIASLLQEQRVLKRELAKHDATLMPLIEELEKLREPLRERRADYEEAERDHANTKEAADTASGAIDFFTRRAKDGGEYAMTYIRAAEKILADDFPNKYSAQLRSEYEVKRAKERLQPYESKDIRLRTSKEALEKVRTYQVFIKLVFNEHATGMSNALAHYAGSNGTSLDAMFSKIGDLVRPFADGKLTREALDRAVEWAQLERGNVDMPAEQLAFKQFINRIVMPSIGSFETFASMVDDLSRTGIKDNPPLEILREKPVAMSGKR